MIGVAEEVKKEVLKIYESLESEENLNMGALMKESMKQLQNIIPLKVCRRFFP